MEEIILPVSELKKALPGLNKIVPKKSPLPILQAVRVARDANGQLTIRATDLDSFATYHVQPAQPGPAAALLVLFDQLTRIVKGMKAEGTISLIPDGKERLKLRFFIAGQRVEQTLRTWPVDEFPFVPEVNQPSIPLEPEFGTALRQALECSSDNPARRILNGACLDVTDKKSQHLVGADGRMLFYANSFDFELEQSVIIPDSKFLAWTEFLEEKPASLCVEPGLEAQPAKDGQPAREARPGYVKLESGPWTFITEAIEGKFPDWKQAVPEPNGNWTRVHLSHQAIGQLLLVMPHLPGAEQPNSPIRLRVTGNYLLVEGQNKEQEDWTSISIQDVAVTGGFVTIALNRHYLLKALRFGLHDLEIEDDLHPVVFSDSSSKKTMVVMPISLDESKEAGWAPTQSSPEATTPSAQPAAPQEPPRPTTQEKGEDMVSAGQPKTGDSQPKSPGHGQAEQC